MKAKFYLERKIMDCNRCDDKLRCEFYMKDYPGSGDLWKAKKLCKEKEKLDYSELREEIHKILCDFLSYEHPLQNDGEFDFEFLEFRTDDILKLIKRQGGSITK